MEVKLLQDQEILFLLRLILALIIMLALLAVVYYLESRGKEKLLIKIPLFILFAIILFLIVMSFFNQNAFTFLLYLLFTIPKAIIGTILLFIFHDWLSKKWGYFVSPTIIDLLKEMPKEIKKLGIRQYLKSFYSGDDEESEEYRRRD